ncbi:MAG: hypothetical protein WD066_16590 [Planctomycetaceae bacterium]
MVGNLDPKFVPVRRDGKTYYVWADLNQVLYLPDDRTIIIATADFTDAQMGRVLRDGAPLTWLSPAETASIAEVPAGDARLLLRRTLMQPLAALAAAAAGPQADERRQREETEYVTLSELTDVAFALRGDRAHFAMRFLCRDEAGARRIAELQSRNDPDDAKQVEASLAAVPEHLRRLILAVHVETIARRSVRREGNVSVSSSQVGTEQLVALIDQGVAAVRAAQSAEPQNVPEAVVRAQLGLLQTGDLVDVVGDERALRDGNNVLGIVPKGTRLRVEAINGEWLLVEASIAGVGRKGWIARSQVTQVVPAVPK